MVVAAQHSENWRYQHDGEVDFADLVIVAHLHQLMTNEAKASQLEKVPAFRRLFRDMPDEDDGPPIGRDQRNKAVHVALDLGC